MESIQSGLTDFQKQVLQIGYSTAPALDSLDHAVQAFQTAGGNPPVDEVEDVLLLFQTERAKVTIGLTADSIAQSTQRSRYFSAGRRYR